MNNNDNDSDDGDYVTDEQDKDEDIRKKKKSSGKLSHKKKNRISTHNRKRKSHNRIVKKYDNHREKKQRIKRHVITTKVHSKHASHSVRHNKINGNQNKTEDKKIRKHKKNLPLQLTTEELNEDDEELVQKYTDYISKVAYAIAKEKGTKIFKEQIDKDIKDMVEFYLKLANVSVISSRCYIKDIAEIILII